MLVAWATAAGCIRVQAPDRAPIPAPYAEPADRAMERLRQPPPPGALPGEPGTRRRDIIGGIVEAFGKDLVLGTTGGTMLSARDALIAPGDTAVVEVLVRGQRLRGLAGHKLRFVVEGRTLADAVTDETGMARAGIVFPSAGTYVVRVHWVAGPENLGAVPAAESVVAVRPRESRFVVVDLDGTVVDEHLSTALFQEDGGLPVPGAADALSRIEAAGWDVLYLTARPEELHLRNRAWLRRHGFPNGPLFEGPLDGDIAFGGGRGKVETLRRLRQAWPGVSAGVGDRLSDAVAYAGAGMTPFLLQRPGRGDVSSPDRQAQEAADAPPGTRVVGSWRAIEAALCPRGR